MVKYLLKDSIYGKIPYDCTHFDCHASYFKSFPELLETLEIFDCGNNILSDLPKLPQTLKTLICYNNKLSYLPELPETLINLGCYNNNIKYLSSNNCYIIYHQIIVILLKNLDG